MPLRAKNNSPPPTINLKGLWLKAAGFEIGFTFTVKILNGCLVLIPDSEDIRTIKQQNQQQQAQIAAFKLKVKALIGDSAGIPRCHGPGAAPYGRNRHTCNRIPHWW